MMPTTAPGAPSTPRPARCRDKNARRRVAAASRVTRGALCAVLAACTTGCGQASTTQAPDDAPALRRAPAVVPSTDGGAVEARLRFPAPRTHYVEVEEIVPAPEEKLDLFMAVWTPGSYVVRDYSRHVESLTAASLAGEPLPAVKTAKNRWRVDTGDQTRVVIRYRVYAGTLSTQTNFVDEDLAVLNGAPTFLAPVGRLDLAYDISFEPPEGWTSVTALAPHPAHTPHRYLAEDYDALVDAPVLLGPVERHAFTVDDVRYTLALSESSDVFDGTAVARDLEALVPVTHRLFRDVPFHAYHFLSVLTSRRGGSGLEHKASTLLVHDRFLTRRPQSYRRYLGLLSHEFFHAWNVKRLRPRELGPFDYEREVTTTGLWVAEGLTTYYADLLLRRAGLLDQTQYLERLSRAIERTQTTPGRRVQPLSQASFDAWIRFYRPDENSRNVSVSYYAKGAVVGFLLDAEIRRRTRGDQSLDDVMRLAYQRFAGEHGFRPAEFRDLCSEVAGESMSAFFARAVDSTDELDFSPALDWYGLRFTSSEPKAEGEGARPARLGVRVETSEGRQRVREVLRGGAAYEAGVSAGDELLAIDGYRLPRAGLDERLLDYRAGDEVTLTIARRGRLRELQVTLGEKDPAAWALAPAEQPTAAQTRHLSTWLARVEVPTEAPPDAGPKPAAE